MSLKKQLLISYFKMASISLFAGLLTLACYNIFLSALGSSEKELFLSSFLAYVTGIVANFFMQALNGSHKPTARKMILFVGINILTAALASVTSTYLITTTSLNDDRILINVLYSLTVVVISPLTFFLYSVALKNNSAHDRNRTGNNRNNI